MDRHGRAVYNLLARMLRDPALAEDLAQDTFVRAHTHLARFDPHYRFSSWLLRIAHNLAIDALRRRGPALVSLDDAPDGQAPRAESIPSATPEDALQAIERQDLGRALAAAMEHLRPDYRRLVVLRYQEDLGYEEISRITGLPLGSVKSFLHRARAEMARRLSAAGWHGKGGCNPGAPVRVGPDRDGTR